MVICAVFGCSNHSRDAKKKGFQLHRFPKDERLCAIWLRTCKRNDKFNLKTARICSIHFKKDDYAKSLQQVLLKYSPVKVRTLKNDAIPTLHLPNSKVTCSSSTYNSESKNNNLCILDQKTARAERSVKRAKRALINELFLTDEVKTESTETTQRNVKIKMEEENECIVEKNDTSTEELSESELKEKISQLEKDVKFWQNEARVKNRELQMIKKMYRKSRLTILNETVGHIFTEGQIKLLCNPKRKILWSPNDIASAISLRNVSSKAYRYLKDKLHFPLPCVGTLRKWSQCFNIEKGILHDTCNLMKEK